MTQLSSTRLYYWHAGAFLLYACCAWLFIDHGVSLLDNVSGSGKDPYIFIWDFAWWPWAITHHQNLLHTDLLWQPLGVYLGWITSIPLLSVIGAPLTLWLGPVFTYNFFILLAPIFAAYTTYFLCLKITKNPVAAVFGGYLFGFSSYEMAQEIAALNLNFTMFIPALLLVILMRLDDELSRWQTCALASLLLVCEFMTCIEFFALIFVFGGITWLFALLYLDEYRPKLRRLFVDGLYTAPLTLIMLSPFLVSMLTHIDYVKLPEFWPYYFTIDLFNIVIPGHNNLLGGTWFPSLYQHFHEDFQEQDGYIGIPLLVILYLFFKGRAGGGAPRFLLMVLLTLIIFSFGPQLWVNGAYSALPLPWVAVMKLPFLSAALPCRFFVFASLAVAVIAARWLAGMLAQGRHRFACAMAVLSCLALLPGAHPWGQIPAASFFKPGRVTSVLGHDPQIMIIPSGINGFSSYWQVESDFSFHQTGGYLGFAPGAMQPYQAVRDFYLLGLHPEHPETLKAYCVMTHTQYIVAGPGTPPDILDELAHLNWPVQKIDDVMIVTVPQRNS